MLEYVPADGTANGPRFHCFRHTREEFAVVYHDAASNYYRNACRPYDISE